MAREEEIKKIEEELSRTKYNKATQKHIGILKAKLARLRQEGGAKGGKKGVGYAVKKSGDATVLLVGFPSVGKSTLLNVLTNADSKVAAYEFTTLDVIPGVLWYNGAKIQMLDIPGIIEGVTAGRGRGREVLSVVRIADLVLILLDVAKWEQQLAVIEHELNEAGFRLNQRPPDVRIQKTITGGIRVDMARRMEIGKETIRSVLNEFSITNAQVLIRQPVTIDQLIDVVLGNRVYVPSLVVVNKMDTATEKARRTIEKRPAIPLSATEGINLERLKEQIWEKLDLMRVYLKKAGKEADLQEPLVIRKNATVQSVCERIHKDFVRRFTYARIWGPSAKFGGQKVGPDHALKEGDVVEIHAA